MRVKNGLILNGLYQHYKGDYYKLIDIGKLHDSQNIFIVFYHKCDKNGVYISIRPSENEIIHQPFCTDINRFNEIVNVSGKLIPRFKFIKSLDG